MQQLLPHVLYTVFLKWQLKNCKGKQEEMKTIKFLFQSTDKI